MTNSIQTNTTQLPDFYIYIQVENGVLVPVGRAYKHGKGSGMNILVDGKRYAAFEPKAKVPSDELSS
jgi:hypothetical protein